MRTTVTLDDDVAAALEQLRRERGLRLSQVLNDVVRAGLSRPKDRKPFVQRSVDMGLALIDIRNTADVIEYLEGPTAR